MNALLDASRDALLVAVTIGLPLLAVGVVAGLAAGWLAQLTGLTDPAVSTGLRAAAIVGALWWTGGDIAERVTAMTGQTWALLPSLGHAGVPSPPGPVGAPQPDQPDQPDPTP